MFMVIFSLEIKNFFYILYLHFYFFKYCNNGKINSIGRLHFGRTYRRRKQNKKLNYSSRLQRKTIKMKSGCSW